MFHKKKVKTCCSMYKNDTKSCKNCKKKENKVNQKTNPFVSTNCSANFRTAKRQIFSGLRKK